MSPEQRRFLVGECFSMTLMATVQRANVYSDEAPEPIRDAFRRGLRSELEQLTKSYRQVVPSADHVAKVAALADRLSAAHGSALVEGRFRIGCAQKSLNLYLKYMWCLGLVETPPHCPFDYEVISRLPDCQGIRWTQMDSVAEYERLVDAATKKAQGMPLAEWELKVYNDA